jgi:hypothetical protein
VFRGQRLEYFTVAWNTLEGLIAVVAGIIAGSISLMGFGIDSSIEVTSGSVLLWRMSVDSDVHRRETNEKRALRIVGTCFLLLAAQDAGRQRRIQTLPSIRWPLRMQFWYCRFRKGKTPPREYSATL